MYFARRIFVQYFCSVYKKPTKQSTEKKKKETFQLYLLMNQIYCGSGPTGKLFTLVVFLFAEVSTTVAPTTGENTSDPFPSICCHWNLSMWRWKSLNVRENTEQGCKSILAMSNVQPLLNGKGHFLLDMYLLSNMGEGHCLMSNWALSYVNIIQIE